MFYLQVLLNSVISGTTVLLLAAGLYLIYLTSRVYHIALAGIMVVGAYGYYAVIAGYNSPFFALICGLAASAILGLFSYFLLAEMIRKNQSMIALLVSVASWISLKALLAIVFGSEGRFLINEVLKVYPFAGGLTIQATGLYILITGFLTAIFTYAILHYSPVGRRVRAVGQNPDCAQLLKIKTPRLRMTVFILSAMMAGLIGILNGMNTAINPSSGTDLIIMAFAANLVGGANDFKGIVFASYLLAAIPEFLVSLNYGGFSFSSSWKLVIFFLMALILLLIKPQGLFVKTVRNY